MEFLKILTLRGPNIWSRHPVLEAWVDLEDLKDSPSNVIPGFTDRLMTWLPSLIEHRCSVGERGGFLKRLQEGTWPAHIMEHVTLELQTLAGTPVGYGRAREMSIEGRYKVAVRFRDERVARASLFAARDLLLAAVHARAFDVAETIARLRDLADRVCLGPSTQAIVEAAEARNIPTRRLNEGSLVQLGHGRKQRRIWTAETDRSSAVAGSIAQDKALTKSLLRDVGVPVPLGRIVSDPDDAWAAAQEVGVPVVVKPRDANHARGVFTGLTTKERVARAFELALKEGSGVLVEQFAPGEEHRLLVVGRRLVAATRGEAAYVVGDGRRTVRQLIDDQLNTDPRRGLDEAHPLCIIELDEVTLMQLEQQGYQPDAVPADGSRVLVQRSDNLAIDVTDRVHPSIAAHAILATQVVGLDIAGLDLVVQDIGRPLEEQGGVFVEVNAGPGLLMHLKPSVGRPRPVGEAIVGELFPDGEDGRIPIACVTGTNGKTVVARLISAVLTRAGRTVGIASSDGIAVGARALAAGDCAGPRSARQVLMHPDVDAAVLEAGRGGILREGLGFDKCAVAVVTNIGTADHLGDYDLHTPEDMFKVKRSPVDVALPTGAKVLNAADPLVADMATLGAGSTIFFAPDPEHPRMVAARSAGERAVYVRDGAVVLATGAAEARLVPVGAVPLTHGGRVAFQVENVLAAAAALWALALPLEVIRDGLSAVRGDLDDLPGRFNILHGDGATVILDDCHNLSALEALIAALEGLEHRPTGDRRTVVYSAGHGRRDADIVAQAHRLADSFDRVVLYHDPAASDRTTETLFALFRRGLADARRTREILEVGDPGEARRIALQARQPGDLIVIQAEDQNPGPAIAAVRAIAGSPPREGA